ncbi:MAG: hypothetical protein U0457_00980 [Candidatus Sericytochromatia bacterium]
MELRHKPEKNYNAYFIPNSDKYIHFYVNNRETRASENYIFNLEENTILKVKIDKLTEYDRPVCVINNKMNTSFLFFYLIIYKFRLFHLKKLFEYVFEQKVKNKSVKKIK